MRPQSRPLPTHSDSPSGDADIENADLASLLAEAQQSHIAKVEDMQKEALRLASSGMKSSLERQTKVAFIAAAACELSFCPNKREGETSWVSSLMRTLISGLSYLTTRIGIVVSKWIAGSEAMADQPALSTPPPAESITDKPVAASPVLPRNPMLADRKLALLRRAGLFGPNTQGARIARAATLEDLRKAYKLVHDVYLGTGFIDAEPAGMRLRIFETTSDTATFVAKVNGRVVGVLSVVGDSPELGLPSDLAFKQELDVLRETGAKLCEVTNQAIADDFRKSALSTELIRCAVAHGIQAGYTQAIATVSPSHNGFYELLGFRSFGSERSYSGKIHDPVVALRMDVNHYRRPLAVASETEQFIYQFLSSENHFLAYVGEWEMHAKRHFLNADLLQQLFVTERNFVAECSPDELRILHRRWGRELFSAVTGSLFLPPVELASPPPSINQPYQSMALELPSLETPIARAGSHRARFPSRLRNKLLRGTRKSAKSGHEATHRVADGSVASSEPG